MPRLNNLLTGVTRIGLDTMSVIYYVEANPQYVSLARPFFQRINQGRLTGVVSTITLLEVLVQPLRLGKLDVADQYRALLAGSENFSILPLTPAMAETAADLRARYHLGTADSAVVATAIEGGCQALVSNDNRLLRVQEMRIVLLDSITE